MLRHIEQSSNSPGDPEGTDIQEGTGSRVGPFILGTLVGGLAGFVIHAVGEAVSG